ncbi:hypothetical protein Sste5346_008899 [Sporothrix stenoceras]|uniref:Uncharacterized protein n=1 Tax=Sporothrix stenoceras TaxID=5173 RepID=A0ABR3YM33_9PEZI
MHALQGVACQVPLRPIDNSKNGLSIGSRKTRRRSRAAEVSSKHTDAPATGEIAPSSSDDDRFLVSGYQAATADEANQDSLDSFLDSAESRARRLTELRLLHHYLLQQTWTFGQAPIPGAVDTGSSNGSIGAGSVNGSDEQDPFIWAVDLVGRAIEGDGQDSILYVLLAHSALGLWVGHSSASDDRKDRETRTANRLLHQQYLALALRAQRRAVAALLATSSSTEAPKTSTTEAQSTPSSATTTSPTAIELADAVGTASVLLVNHSFALVQTLALEPWQPPHEWLQMGRGAMQVMEVAKGYLGGTLVREKKRREDAVIASAAAVRGRRSQHPLPPPPPSSRESKEYPSLVAKLLHGADMFSPVWAAPYLWLLEEPVSDPDRSARDANGDGKYEYDGGEDKTSEGGSGTSLAPYYATLAYIGWCAAAVARPDEPINTICRRLEGAAYWFPGALEERLRQRRPRARPLRPRVEKARGVDDGLGRSTPSSGYLCGAASTMEAKVVPLLE